MKISLLSKNVHDFKEKNLKKKTFFCENFCFGTNTDNLLSSWREEQMVASIVSRWGKNAH
jgi:hypothetical protein